MALMDHLASVVTLVGFPLILFGLFDLYRERKLSMWRARKWVGIALLVLGCAAWGTDAADRFGFIQLTTWGLYSNSGPIVWNFDETAKGHGYFLNMQKPPDEAAKVVSFGGHGKNISSRPIEDFDGYLRSDKTNETIPIYIMAYDLSVSNACTLAVPTLPKDTLGIPPFADFDVATNKKPYFVNAVNDGMSLTDFQTRFVPFTIVTKYDGKKYEHHFSKPDVDLQVSMLEKLSKPLTNPFVVRKPTAPPVSILPPLSIARPPVSLPSNNDVVGKVPEK